MSLTTLSVTSCSYHISSHPKQMTILKDINFSVDAPSITLIGGRSGSGKTTLLHCLSGLIVPQSGDIHYGETCFSALSSNDRALFRLDHMGVVYQSFNFLPSLSLKENIILPAVMAKRPHDDYLKDCHDLCEELGIADKQDAMPQMVSGGELQRATLVRALINQPDFIFADEPTGNLDTSHRDIIFDCFKRIVREKNVRVIFTSHDPKAKDIADTFIELHDGRMTSS